METRDLEYIAMACGGELVAGSPDVMVDRVCTDSRMVKPGDLFIALPGDRFDGHDYLTDVIASGVSAVLVCRSKLPRDIGSAAVIAVEDTRKAFGMLAARYRKDFKPPIIAVGGSNGKTTTKDIIASVLRQRFETLWSEASFNNDIGVPMTLLKLGSDHKAVVMEVGTNHPGELAPLVRIIQPTFGVITSIGREHLEFFKDIDGVAEEEGWLAELLPSNGKLFINGDSGLSESVAARARCNIIRVGFDEGNAWRIVDARMESTGTLFRVEAPTAEFSGEYRIGLLGRHQALNALFAIAIAAELGIDRTQVLLGLIQCKPAKMRLELWEAGGVQVLDDAYNANADSMVAALRTLQEFPCKGRRVAVLGDMAELGGSSREAHEEIGRRAAELGVAQLFAVGTMAEAIARGAREAGLNRVFEFADVETAASAVKSFVRSGDALLLKASRATRIERIGEMLRGEPMAFVS
jgi:UDP-N-acetylmuramoyl-tripeptide--D-alanyl-D-alanine ligase